jgi:beta-lactamase class A
VALLALLTPLAASAAPLPGPLQALQDRLDQAAFHAPGTIGIAVEDLATGMTSGINESASLPAASTIKIPVMVEVFRQMSTGTIDLNTRMHLLARDRDWGSGDLAGARIGDRKTVEQLLWLMINDSDNTATNMLIRRVGRQNVNRTMAELGLRTTRLGDDIRTETEQIRYALRSSPRDMVRLLDGMARDTLIDTWSSREMLAILNGQTHNGLLPSPLPKELKIAHKTGSLHDTLNDVGIVYLSGEPYVIAVMTTRLRSLSTGRHFIRNVSKITYDEIGRLEAWRQNSGLPAFTMAVRPKSASSQALAPDLKMWGVSDAPPFTLPGSDP